MLPPEPTLASVACRFLNLKCLDTHPNSLSFKPEPNPLVGSSLPHDDPCTVPLNVNYNRNEIDDGFYKVNVSLLRQLEVPTQCRLQVLHWTIEVTPQGLIFIIQRANVISTLHLHVSSDLCRLENNVSVRQLLRALQHRKLKEYFDGRMDIEAGSDVSANSALLTQNLLQLGPLHTQEVEDIDANPRSQISVFAQAMQTTQTFKQLVEQEAQTTQSIFDSKKRPIKSIQGVDFTEDDLISLQQDETTWSLKSATVEPGVFPGWALEYLRFYYKV